MGHGFAPMSRISNANLRWSVQTLRFAERCSAGRVRAPVPTLAFLEYPCEFAVDLKSNAFPAMRLVLKRTQLRRSGIG